MPIYTRTGDKGQTSFRNGQRISKSDLRVDVYGTVDELNSAIGIVISGIKNKELRIKNELIRTQNDLLSIGSNLANPSINNELLTMNYLQKRVKDFENFIDQMTKQMPVLKNFILPGGGKTGALLHFARTICRRAERNLVKLSEKEQINSEIIIYVNRLSDLLFTMARFSNFKEKKKEIIWRARK
ncbi:MAG: cob(I)yrinic acid a,c-diamide adenosyltransferase [Patescibacteria group bacterium]